MKRNEMEGRRKSTGQPMTGRSAQTSSPVLMAGQFGISRFVNALNVWSEALEQVRSVANSSISENIFLNVLHSNASTRPCAVAIVPALSVPTFEVNTLNQSGTGSEMSSTLH
jgi:hypothetical protein